MTQALSQQLDDDISSTCHHGMRRKLVVELLVSEILLGKLKAGKRLIIKEISDRFQVSSTPIREALVQLESIGLIDFVPNSGAIVRKVTRRDVSEICSVRRVLECEATRKACGSIDLGQLHDLAGSFRTMQTSRRRGASFVDKARHLDSRLHDLIVESSGNRFLAEEIGRLKLLYRTFRDVSWEHRIAKSDYYRFAEEAAEHLKIVEALIASDAKAASRAMAKHIRAGLKYWGRNLPVM